MQCPRSRRYACILALPAILASRSLSRVIHRGHFPDGPLERLARRPREAVRLVRAGFRMILTGERDIQVVGEAGDGREAARQAAVLAPDVVLMDIRMPGLDGIEATRQITAAAGAPRVLILTTFDEDAKEEQLLAAIRVVADGGSLFSPSVTRRLIERFAKLGAPSPLAASLEQLTARELEVLRLGARGLSNAEIRRGLVVSEHTTKTYVASILQKLHLRNRVQAVVLAYESGLVRPASSRSR